MSEAAVVDRVEVKNDGESHHASLPSMNHSGTVAETPSS
jgi:hypothetical protein